MCLFFELEFEVFIDNNIFVSAKECIRNSFTVQFLALTLRELKHLRAILKFN